MTVDVQSPSRLCLVAWFIVEVLLGGLEAGPQRPVLSCRLTNMFILFIFLGEALRLKLLLMRQSSDVLFHFTLISAKIH